MTNSPINMAFSAPWSKKFRENKIQRKMAGQIFNVWTLYKTSKNFNDNKIFLTFTNIFSGNPKCTIINTKLLFI